MAAEGTDEPSAREPADVATAKPAGLDLPSLLPLVGLGVAVWASLPKYSGPKLNVEASKEFADHIVPAIVVLLASLAGIMAGRRADGPGGTRFIAGMVVLLAGLWMLATHLPLVAEAMRDQAPWPATIYHTAAALAVFGLGLLWSAATWSEAGDESQAPAK